MKEIEFSPELIAQEVKRLEEEQNLTDTQALAELIKVFGSKSIANYLNWKANLTYEEHRE